MSKKRRDKEHDSSKLGKVAKIGAAALTVGVGTAAFGHLGLTKKLTTEVLPALGSTKKAISKELRTAKSGRQGLNRRLQAEDIKNVYNNHLKGNKTLKKELEQRAKQKIKFDVSNKRDNVLGQVLNIKQVINNDLPRALREDAFSHKLIKNHTDRLANKYKDKNINYKDMSSLVKSAIKEIDGKYTEKDGKLFVSSDFLDDRLKKSGFGLKQGKFDAEAQKEAFLLTSNAVIEILSDDAKIYLTAAVGDLNTYITKKIEAEVNINKIQPTK